MIMATYHAHTQFNNHSDPNRLHKREHDLTHIDQQHHAEADCALVLTASLLQKDLDATTKQLSLYHPLLDVHWICFSPPWLHAAYCMLHAACKGKRKG